MFGELTFVTTDSIRPLSRAFYLNSKKALSLTIYL